MPSRLEKPCLVWTGNVNQWGYGLVNWLDDGKVKGAAIHVLAYQHLVGPIPLGPDGKRLDLDHECHNYDPDCSASPCIHRLCFEPTHLVPRTRGENVLAGKGLTAVNSRKTHCHRGHEFTPENAYRQPSTGDRRCRQCELIHRVSAQAKKRSGAQPA